MADNVKFIFKTLLQVPIIVFFCYLIFNIFAFAHSYFQALGLSYVVMQTAVENNYIPDQEMSTLRTYANSLGSEMANNYQIVAYCSDGQNRKQQYGKAFTAGVSYNYRVIWPLMPYEQNQNYDPENGVYGQVEGMNGTDTTGGYASETDIERRQHDSWHDITFPVTIKYQVPGLKYYADLAY